MYNKLCITFHDGKNCTFNDEEFWDVDWIPVYRLKELFFNKINFDYNQIIIKKYLDKIKDGHAQVFDSFSNKRLDIVAGDAELCLVNPIHILTFYGLNKNIFNKYKIKADDIIEIIITDKVSIRTIMNNMPPIDLENISMFSDRIKDRFSKKMTFENRETKYIFFKDTSILIKEFLKAIKCDYEKELIKHSEAYIPEIGFDDTNPNNLASTNEEFCLTKPENINAFFECTKDYEYIYPWSIIQANDVVKIEA